MGGVRAYISTGGFSQYLYHQVGETIEANGVSGKVIERKDDSRTNHTGLPLFSNTSDVYFKLSDENDKIEMARLYRDRKVSVDFDWGHPHGKYKKNIVHVHEIYQNSDGKWVRKEPRMMNNEEMKKYGPLLKKANPEIKFR